MKPDRRDKFVQLAEKRVNRTLKDIRLVGNLSNKSNYSYTDQDVKKIVSALKRALDDMQVRFDRNSGGSAGEFRL